MDESTHSADLQTALATGEEQIQQQLQRFYALETSLTETERELRRAAEEISSVPPGPNTLRARAARLSMQCVNRLLWWRSYEHRRIVDLLLQLPRLQTDQLAALAAALGECSRHAAVIRQWNVDLSARLAALEETTRQARQETVEMRKRLERLLPG